MSDSAAEVRKLLRHQAAIARFGSFALRERDLLKILTEAARVCAEGLNVPFSKVCRYRAAENDLLIEAGEGWSDGVVGAVESADPSSPQGRVFVTGEPYICNDLRMDHEFDLPEFYARHGIISTIGVVIKGSADQPYGVLEIDGDEQHDYDQHDIDFLTAFANVLAEAVATSARTRALLAAIEEKDRLLDQSALHVEAARLGATLAVIAVEPFDPRPLGKDAASFPFLILPDKDRHVAQSYGLTYEVSAQNSPEANDTDNKPEQPQEIMSAPATFVLDQTGLVVLSFVDVECRSVMDHRQILMALECLGGRNKS
jgi:peroxiredoxin